MIFIKQIENKDFTKEAADKLVISFIDDNIKK